MLKLVRTDAKHPDFENLVSQLNSYLKTIDGNDHEFYMQYNGIAILKHVIVAYLNGTAVGCGAFKVFDVNSVEIKRMYTVPEFRGQQIASQILIELETWASELGYTVIVLETGKRQTAAVNFYKKNNYNVAENFGPYKNVDNSICFEKKLSYEEKR